MGSGNGTDHHVKDVPAHCWVDRRVVVRPSSIHGLGLFATAPIAEGEAVARLGGKIIDDSELRQIARTRSKYNSAAIDEGVNLLLDDSELLVRGNHSCDPSLWMRDEVTLEARRPIAANEEVTVDYALQTGVDNWKMMCNCGSAACRRVIRGSDWSRPDLQKRYGDHFSPFLVRRIRVMRNSTAPTSRGPESV